MLNYTQYVCKHGCSERKCEICENESMNASFAAALKALEDYGQHPKGCGALDFKDYARIDDSDCTCGLSAKWRELKGRS